MLKLSLTRRRFLGSTSFVATAAAVPAALAWSGGASAAMLVSEERAPLFGVGSRAVLLEGPRIARLQAMTEALPRLHGEVVLRLDATDESLLDVAAQQAGVLISRQSGQPDDQGVRARVTPTGRKFA